MCFKILCINYRLDDQPRGNSSKLYGQHFRNHFRVSDVQKPEKERKNIQTGKGTLKISYFAIQKKTEKNVVY